MAPPQGKGVSLRRDFSAETLRLILTTIKRINKEIQDLAKEDTGGIVLTHSEADLFHWTGWIPGPQGSPYEGGRFEVGIELPGDYPFSAPKLRFKTKVYHCNVNRDGNICLDTLKNNWSPALSLFKVMLSLSSLLTDPNPRDPLDPAVASLFKSNRAEHDRVAREWTKLYALPPESAAKRKAGEGAADGDKAGAKTVKVGEKVAGGSGAAAILRGASGSAGEARPAGSSRTASSTSLASGTSRGARAGEPIVLGFDDEDDEEGDTADADARDAAAADGAIGGRRVKRKKDDGAGTDSQPIVLD